MTKTIFSSSRRLKKLNKEYFVTQLFVNFQKTIDSEQEHVEGKNTKLQASPRLVCRRFLNEFTSLPDRDVELLTEVALKAYFRSLQHLIKDLELSTLPHNTCMQRVAAALVGQLPKEVENEIAELETYKKLCKKVVSEISKSCVLYLLQNNINMFLGKPE